LRVEEGLRPPMPQSDGVAPAVRQPCGHDPSHACAHQHGHEHKPSAVPFDAKALIAARGVGIARNAKDCGRSQC